MRHRARHLFIRRQTAVINSIRAYLAEFGIVAPAVATGPAQHRHRESRSILPAACLPPMRRCTVMNRRPTMQAMPTTWNKEQAVLLRIIALAGGSCPLDKCHGPALNALIETGFVRLQGSDLVVLTDAGLARARDLRRRKPL